MNTDLEDARRELIEIEGEYFNKKSRLVFCLIVERLKEIQDKALELFKEYRLKELENLNLKLVDLR